MAANNTQLTPAIIGVADSTHYLVGMTDANNNFFAMDNSNDITVVSSLSQAKQVLVEHNIFSATLEYQTPYDEMCGSAVCEPSRQFIRF